MVVLVVAVHVLSTHGAPETRDRLRHTDVPRQTELGHQDVKWTRIYPPTGLVEGQSTRTGLVQDRQHGQSLAHPPFLRQQSAKIIVIAAIQGLYPVADEPDPEGREVVRYHHPERHMRDIGGDLFPAVIDQDPIHTLNTLAHVRPEDAENTPHRRPRAFRHHLRHDIDQEDEGLRR